MKTINEQIENLVKYDNNSAPDVINANLNTLFVSSKEAANKANKTLSKLEKEIIATIDLFHTNLSTIYDDNIALFKSIMTELSLSKRRLEYAQTGYYKTAYDAQSFHKCSTQVNVNGNSNEKPSSLIEKEIAMKARASIYEQSYKYEIERYNEVIHTCNMKYNKMTSNLKQNEKSQVYFIKFSIEKFLKLINELSIILKELISNVNFLFSNDCEKEMGELSSSTTDNANRPRISTALYISYKEFCSNNIIDESTFNLGLSISNTPYSINKDQCEKIIERAIEDLLDEKDVSITLIAQIMEILKGNMSMAKKFLDTFLKKKSNVWITFANYNNLVYLSNIILFISITNGNIFKEKFLLNFTIVFIAERVFYLDKTTMNKVYLSALLSKSAFFKTTSLWKDIIELKLAKKLDDHIVPLTNMKIPEDDTTSILSKLGNKLGLNKTIKKNSLIYKSRIKKCIRSIDDLPIEKIPTLDSIATSELIGIIKESIPNMASFNISHDNAISLIEDLQKDYQIPKTQIEFFITYYNVCSYTIRKRLLNNDQYGKEDEYKSPYDKAIKAIKLSIAFLTCNDYISLLQMSKSSHKAILIKIYKNRLKDHSLSNKARLAIWSSILNISSLKKQFDYKALSTDLSKLDENVSYEIQIDVPRTYISSQCDKNKAQMQIANILNAICQVNDKIKYCQGMNYVVQFILEITKDEELAFYIFLGFFKSTEYSMIFAKELLKIKSFFYIFQRMMSLFQPELSNYFNANNFEVNSFLAPWFITLFQSVRSSVTGPEMPFVLIRVFDDFLTSGWKALIKIGLNVLRYYETDLFQMKYEDLIQFLVNSSLTLDYFENKNLAIYDKMIRETKIPKKLVKYIEEEFNLDESFEKKDKGNK